MKNCILYLILLFCVSTVYSMDLYNLNPREEQVSFEKLSMEDKYFSILSSFEKESNGKPILYETIWAEKVVKEYGREILGLINQTLKEKELFNEYRSPVNRNLSTAFQFLFELGKKDLLSETELSLYEILINEKIDKYILKYRVIDRAVFTGFALLIGLNRKTLEWDNIENLKEYYEKKLGIVEISIGDEIFENIVPSPLAEYITD